MIFCKNKKNRIRCRLIWRVLLSTGIFSCGQAAVAAFSLQITAQAVLPAAIQVDEAHPIKAVNNQLLGFGYEWPAQVTVCGIPDVAGYDTNVTVILQGLSLPLNRSAGLSANLLDWKGAIGPYANRSEQTLADWCPDRKLGLGPVEWVQMVRAIDPAAHSTWTVNLSESTNDTADLVEFFTGDGVSNPNGGTNWAQVRISCGITNPVAVDVWELGNELDGLENRAAFQNITNYTDLCRAHIAAIRSVQPDVKIAAHAATLSSLSTYEEFFGGPWSIWHQNVLREIGDDIDYLVFHSYYNSLPASRLESYYIGTIAEDILSITGSDRIKIYNSEQSWYPKTNDCPLGATQWKDSWYTTHALLGCLATADWITRIMNSSAVAMASYHAFSGGARGLVYKSEHIFGGGDVSTPLYTTGIVDLYELLDDAFRGGISIVPVSVSGPNTDRSVSTCLFTAAALTTADGVNLILVNRDTNTARSVDLSFQWQYVPVEMTVLTAPDILSYNTATNRPITVTRTQFPSGTTFSNVAVPAKSLVVLKMKASAISAGTKACTAPDIILSDTSSGGPVISRHAALQDPFATSWISGITGAPGVGERSGRKHKQM